MYTLMVSSRKKCLGGKFLEIAQHEAPYDFLEGVANHYTSSLIS